MRYHYQNLNEKGARTKGSILKHGRAWLYFAETKDAHHTYGIEWAFGSRNCKLGLTLGGDGERSILLTIGIPFILSIYISREFPWGHWIRRFLPDEGRAIGVSIFDWSIWTDIWASDNWNRDDPWYRTHHTFRVLDFLLGKQKYSTRDLEHRDVEIPMPEKLYVGKARLFESTWKRPRWFPTRMVRCEIEVEGGIPKPGKGESAWDCGQDAVYGQTSPATTFHEGVGELVKSVLRDRERHGGMNWRPENEERAG